MYLDQLTGDFETSINELDLGFSKLTEFFEYKCAQKGIIYFSNTNLGLVLKTNLQSSRIRLERKVTL